MPTTVGWTTGAPPTTMTWNTLTTRTVDQVTASLTVTHLGVTDDVTRAVKFVAPTTGQYRISTARDPNASSMDTVLGVYSATGNRLAYNDDTGGTRYSGVTVTLTAGQEYRIGVGHYVAAGVPTDTLTRLCNLTINGPDDDVYEARGGDTLSTSVVLGEVKGLMQVNGLVMADKADYFTFHLAETGVTGDHVRIDFQHALGDLDMKLIDSAGRLVTLSEGMTDSEEISLAGLTAGDYTVKIFGYNGVTNPRYDLSLLHEVPPPPVNVDLGQQLVDWAKARLGQPVGPGGDQCTFLLDEALRANGAFTFSDLGPTGLDVDYVWGTLVLEYHAGDPVDLLDQVRPGDIIQYRDVTISVQEENRFFSFSMPHHTALVEANLGGGSLLVLEQNSNNQKFVTEATHPFAGMTSGTIWIYRPIAR